jgi:hypothetical protein
MRRLSKYILTIAFFLLGFGNSYASDLQPMSPDESKQFIKNAIEYSMGNMDPNMDYSKYISTSFIKHGDGKKLNFEQWVKRQKEIKAAGTLRKPIFSYIIADGDRVGTMYRVHITTKDGTESDVMDLEFFKIKNHKVIEVDELTRPMP